MLNSTFYISLFRSSNIMAVVVVDLKWLFCIFSCRFFCCPTDRDSYHYVQFCKLLVTKVRLKVTPKGRYLSYHTMITYDLCVRYPPYLLSHWLLAKYVVVILLWNGLFCIFSHRLHCVCFLRNKCYLNATHVSMLKVEYPLTYYTYYLSVSYISLFHNII